MKLRTWSTSCSTYEMTFGGFPVAALQFYPHSTEQPWSLISSTGKENLATGTGFNWAVQLIRQIDPKIESVAMRCLKAHPGAWNAADDCANEFGLGTLHAQQTRMEFLCPSAIGPQLPHSSPITQLQNLAKGNYAACLGAGTYYESIEGLVDLPSSRFDTAQAPESSQEATELESKRAVRRGICTIKLRKDEADGGDFAYAGAWRERGVTLVRKIKDGVARTMLMSEVVAVDGVGQVAGASDDLRGVWVSPSMGASTYSHMTTPNSLTHDRINGCEQNPLELPPSSRSKLLCLELPATGPTAADTFAAARSNHPGGVLGATADGAVQFYTDDVNPRVWECLGTRSGGD